MVLGHERDGIPPEAMELADTAVEIPMIGWGASLNVAVAGLWSSTGSRGSSSQAPMPPCTRTPIPATECASRGSGGGMTQSR